jgi:hypothetical protein
LTLLAGFSRKKNSALPFFQIHANNGVPNLMKLTLSTDPNKRVSERAKGLDSGSKTLPE